LALASQLVAVLAAPSAKAPHLIGRARDDTTRRLIAVVGADLALIQIKSRAAMD